MFSSESIIFLNVDILKLKFFKKEHLQVMDTIHDTLISNGIKKHKLAFSPFTVLIDSLSILKICMYLLVFFFFVDWVSHDEISASLSFAIDLLFEFYYFPIIFIISSFLSFILMKLVNCWAENQISSLKNNHFDTKSYVDKLADILEPYERLKIMQLLNDNQNNLFGLIILQYILVSIEDNTIKKSELLFEPINLIKLKLKEN